MLKKRLRLIAIFSFIALFTLLGAAIFLSQQKIEPSSPQLPQKLALEIPYHQKEPYILHFMSSWCRYCQLEYPLLRSLKVQTGYPMIAIAYKEPKQELDYWLDKVGSIFNLTLSDNNGDYAHQMGIYSIPQTLIINDKGQVIHYISHSLTRSTLKKLSVK